MASGATFARTSARVLLVGYPGGGKTGAIASLLNAGYLVRFIDMEGNIAPLLEFADKDKLKNLDILQFRDKLRLGVEAIEPVGIPAAFKGVLETLQGEWKSEDDKGNPISLGRPDSWGPDTVLVLDSLTAFSAAAMARAMKLSNKTRKSMTSAVWGYAMQDMSDALQIMTHPDKRYHLVVLGHLQMIGPEDYLKQGDKDTVAEVKLEDISHDLIQTRLYPRSVTKSHSQAVHKDFSTMILAEQRDKLGKKSRVLRTTVNQPLDLKIPARTVLPEYPLETGLADIFKALGASPKA